ncbi:hypothetical protein NWP22_00470 [Anabaenopsis tanganyikae CS-531]|uniref:Uncharacterized protein n=2 Tax=Anabaenopsis TaxID=110103 RepID=A0ABT5APC8_9CYAN|nr:MULTISPECIES: hypothetical protein [Anabaenopsis]MDB9538558.1 hypothetical protein [Anabaenopsis arnoldii]MDH6090831.1 hypothetical protein [Anabaenopsis arnoldii]MDH6098753.1 hypothetical protein [Anabaenopsis sp. FSS-46]MDH6104372.1 hypothetical protein [Anabaenopsis tanganyikae CS-531]
MMYEDYNAVDAVNELLRKIRIKESQLRLAKTSNLLYTSEVLQNQILELRKELSDSENPEITALMSLLDD